MLHVKANYILDSHIGPCLFPSARKCSRGNIQHTKSIQHSENKEEVHPWENHTGEIHVWVKKVIPKHAHCANIEHPQKRYSSVSIVVVLSVLQKAEDIIETIAHSAFTPATSMTGV